MTQDAEFKRWFGQVEALYMAKLGMGADDGGDAPWYDYYQDGMSPKEAMATALTDWQDDFGMLNLEDIGLGGLV